MGYLTLIPIVIGLLALLGALTGGQMPNGALPWIGGGVVVSLVVNFILSLFGGLSFKKEITEVIGDIKPHYGYTRDGRPYATVDTHKGGRIAIVQEPSGKFSAYGFKHGAFEVGDRLAYGAAKDVGETVKRYL